MFNFIDFNKLNNFTKEELETKLSKQALMDLEFILNTNNKIKLFSNTLLLEYQNTNFENYQFIMKDFINEVNKSSTILINAFNAIYKEFKEIIVDEPSILNHKIIFNEKTNIIESQTIREYYCAYLNELIHKGIIARNFLRKINSEHLKKFESYMQFDRNKYAEDRVIVDENDEAKTITLDNPFQFKKFQGRREALVLNMGKELRSVLRRNKDTIDDDSRVALEFFTYKTDEEHDDYINELYYSVNLSDEKIINKKEQVFFYSVGEKKFDFIGRDIIEAKKKNIVWTYSFESDFNIEYYIRKYLIEEYARKDMFSFMCIYKDFLSNYVYLNHSDKRNFNQKHPMIQEANLLEQVDNATKKYTKRLNFYLDELEQIRVNNKESLILTKSTKEWCELLLFPDATKKFFFNKFVKNLEPTIDEFLVVLNEYGNRAIDNEINKILINDELRNQYKNVKNVLIFLDQSINSIFNRLYYIDEEEGTSTDIFDKSRFFNARERATFHSVLKESLVFDNRRGSLSINENSFKYLNKEQIEEISERLTSHKYHDYIEIDSDVLQNLKSNSINIDEIISMLEKTNKFDFPVPQKCALKFRKLGNYKAIGIYFSFSKQLGVDYRKGKTSYIHEIAHHIDLNTKNDNRKYMVSMLNKYFKYRISNRTDYYLKSEELIARAAEVSLLLLLGRYHQYKEFYDRKEINEETLFQAVANAFKKSKYNSFMQCFESYQSEEYIDIEKEILNCNFEFIEKLLTYFKAFWSGKELSSLEEKRFASNINVEYNNENNFAKKNEYSYDKFYRGLFPNRIIF